MSVTQMATDLRAALLRAKYDSWWKANKHRFMTYRLAWTAGYQKGLEDAERNYLRGKEVVDG